ncbi:MAG: AAA family ATPase [Proteobacteria bacterium]|nr:MAG: AAA family ATPase [Pseudomonadota bacterium]PIE19829.1 MAG: AAA family ATPase [Pseudomonadota bacterium]
MSRTPYDESLQRVIDEASAIATRAGTTYSSAHLLLAMLAEGSAARDLLVDRGVRATQVSQKLAQLDPPLRVASPGGDEEQRPLIEPADMLTRIRDRCRRMAQGCGSAQVGTLHLLIALSSLQKSVAFRILEALGLDLPNLRTIALALVTGGTPRRRVSSAESEAAAPEPAGPLRQGLLRAGEEPRRRTDRLEAARRDPRVTQGNGDDEAAEAQADERFTLDPERFPTITQLGRNLSAAASVGQIEPLVGREHEVEQILDVLGKRRANNPCLVGEPGVGKTAIVEGLAYLQVDQPERVPFLEGRCLVELNMGALVSGTALRGAFSERMASLRDEMEAAEGKVILFLDEIHTLIGAGAAGDGSLDAVSELSTAMAQGKFPCIGATTSEAYRKFIEQAPAFQRRLQPLLVPEPTMEETLAILRGIGPAYAEHHGVAYREEAFDSAGRLAQRYIADRFLPDKAISLLDLAGSRAKRTARDAVGRAEVAELVAEMAKIPVDRLLMADTERFLEMESFLREHIVGHGPILERVCQVVRRNYAGFASNRPIGSFLFLGPTGVGKTELVKVLADFLFSSREALCRLDMSEFMEPHSVARMIGSPPGYVGHEEGGQLTESVRKRPYQIVLLDEVEKAHRDVLQILLQLLDDGRLTDGRGRTVDFSNTVVVMTSNLGSDHYDRRRGPIGFGVASESEGDVVEADDPEWIRIRDEVLKTARRAFPIELWNRIEERLVFEPLSRAQIRKVARLLVADSSERLTKERGIGFEATDAALEYLIDHGGYDPLLGARPMRTTIQRLIESPVAEEILKGAAKEGDQLRVDCVDDKLVVDRRLNETDA